MTKIMLKHPRKYSVNAIFSGTVYDATNMSLNSLHETISPDWYIEVTEL